VYKFILNVEQKDDQEVIVESEIEEVVNIRGKSPLPLMGHTAFYRDRKLFIFGGIKKIEGKDNPQDLLLF